MCYRFFLCFRSSETSHQPRRLLPIAHAPSCICSPSVCPAAAGTEDRAGMTPYDLAAMGRSNSPWLLRLLLRACPALDPDELHRLNYAERRMALFLSERAITATMKPTIFARLRFENKDIVKKIVSFL